MFKLLKDFFKPNPVKKLMKERDVLYKRAVDLQRSGDLRAYGEVMTRINALEEECVRLRLEEEE